MSDAMADERLNQARAALTAGRRQDAYDLLRAALTKDPSSEQGWLLLAEVVDGVEHRDECLERVLHIDRDNEQARQMLALLPPEPFSAVDDGDADGTHSPADDRLRRAHDALAADRRREAHRLLRSLLRDDPRSEQGWLALSLAASTYVERCFCLVRVLDINPDNDAARSLLAEEVAEPPPVAPWLVGLWRAVSGFGKRIAPAREAAVGPEPAVAAAPAPAPVSQRDSAAAAARTSAPTRAPTGRPASARALGTAAACSATRSLAAEHSLGAQQVSAPQPAPVAGRSSPAEQGSAAEQRSAAEQGTAAQDLSAAVDVPFADTLAANPLRWALVYFGGLTVAEVLTALIEPPVGLVLHALFLFALFLHAGFTWGRSIDRLLLALTLAPLMRLLSLSLPLVDFPLVYWYLIVSLPLFAATFAAARVLDLPHRELGLTLRQPMLQVAVAVVGLFLGAVEYQILRPAPLVPAPTLQEIWVPALILVVSTGFGEELIFRGVMQRVAREVVGRWGAVLYVSALFAVLHIGYKSVLDVLFVFVVALGFGWVRERSGSVLGVSLAHGLTNVILFLVAPFSSLLGGGL